MRWHSARCQGGARRHRAVGFGGCDPRASLRKASVDSTGVFLRDVGQGLLEVSHNTLALLGLLLAAVLVFAAGHADVRHQAEAWALGWLQARQEARAEPVGCGIRRSRRR